MCRVAERVAFAEAGVALPLHLGTGVCLSGFLLRGRTPPIVVAGACRQRRVLWPWLFCMLICRAALTLFTWGVQAQGEAPAAATAVSVARGRMHLVAATAWRRHGCASLAAAEAAAFLSCHTLDPDDTLHAYATLALIANDLQGVPPRTPATGSSQRLLQPWRQLQVQQFISPADSPGYPPPLPAPPHLQCLLPRDEAPQCVAKAI